MTPAGEVLQRVNAEFDAGENLGFTEAIKEVFEGIQQKQGGEAVSCGLAAPGLASKDHHSIAHMPGRLHGLEGLNWTEFLGTRAKVPVLNDAHAALVGEAWLGAAKGMSDVIMLTLGTGVGGAAIVDGNLLQGHIGRAGHLGHNCLNMDAPKDVTGIPGSIEYFVGNWNIQERTGGRFATTHAVVDAFMRGDPYATHVWITSMRALAATVATYINVLDPEAVIIGGGLARAGKALFDSLEEALRPIEWQPGGHKVRLVPAQLGEYAGAIGSAKNGLNYAKT